ncbi:MAG: RNB domain-containing ribonuclease, partial [Rubrivivax sp.]
RWLEQNGLAEIEATVIKEGLVRAQTLPLVLGATGVDPLPRGAQVRVRLTGRDLLTLDVWSALVARLDAGLPAAAAGAPPPEDDEEGDEAASAGPLALAIDIDEAPPAASPEPTAPPGAA